MIFKIAHIQNKPIQLEDREAFVSEWKTQTDELLKIRPALTDLDGWKSINNQLDELQAKLDAKYPNRASWEITSIPSLLDLISTYGTLSICKEDNDYVIYVMDLPTNQIISAGE